MSRVVILWIALLSFLVASNKISIGPNTVGIESGGQSLQLQYAPNTFRVHGGMCVNRGFTIQESDFHVEYVAIGQVCEWTGLPSGLYEYFFKSRIKNVQSVAHYKTDDFKITKYQKKEGGVFYYLSMYDVFGNIFVLDYTGDLVTQVCAQCQKIESSERVKFVFDESLIDYNVVGNYFHRESGGGLLPF